MSDFDPYKIKVPALGRAIARFFVTVWTEARDLVTNAPLRMRLLFWGGRVVKILRSYYLLPLFLLAVWLIGPVWFELVDELRAAIGTAMNGAAKRDGETVRALAILVAVSTTALVALVSAPFALVRLWHSDRQAVTAEQALITDRITRAVEQLGAEKTVKAQVEQQDTVDGEPVTRTETIERTEPNLEVRLGAIYALERIAQDSERDHIPIMETLSAYIRQNTNAREPRNFPLGPFPDPLVNPTLQEKRQRDDVIACRKNNWRDWLAHIGPVRPLRDDVAAALKVISRRSAARRELEKNKNPRFYIDLSHANFQCADLSGIDLREVDLRLARLEGANLFDTNLEGVNFFRSHLASANLRKSTLDGADFRSAEVEFANFRSAILCNAIFRGVNLEGISLRNISIIAADFTGALMIDVNLEKSKLNHANIFAADLSGANLKEANLFMSDMSFSKFYLSEMNNSICDRARVRSSDFHCSIGLSQDNMNSCFGDRGTTLPAGGLTRPDHWSHAELERWDNDPEYDDWIARGAPPGKPVEPSGNHRAPEA